MSSSDRLHALDAVRAFALLLGIALHAAQPFIPGVAWPAGESPDDALTGIWYAIHIFRMPLFFLIAGFFGRMMLERRGVGGFIKDRSRRILLPLVVGVPILMLVTAAAFLLGSLATGADLSSLKGLKPPPSRVHHGFLASINLIHLWFLYYLIIFYAGALIVRLASASASRLQVAVDAAVRFLVRGVWGPLLLSVPIAAYYYHLEGWSPWGGLPAPFSLIPDAGALIAYGLFFAFGWLLHRQQQLLLSLQSRWPLYCGLAGATWAVCLALGGTTAHWGPFLKGGALLAYTMSYVMAAWCCSFGLIGVAMRFLSSASPVRRYIADSSYWLYLMHIPALIFFDEWLRPLPWPSGVKYLLSMAGAVPLLLLSYHYLVRFTFIGATLNGRRQPRVTATPPGAPAMG